MFKVWIANLGAYTEGELRGEWVDLEAIGDFEDEIQPVLERIGIDGERYEEIAVFDWDCDVPGVAYCEYPNLEDWHRIATEWVALDDDDQGRIDAYCEMCESDFDAALDNMDDVICHGKISMRDLAEQYVDDMGILDRLGDLRYYFDYKRLARDMEIEGTYYEAPDGSLYEYAA